MLFLENILRFFLNSIIIQTNVFQSPLREDKRGHHVKSNIVLIIQKHTYPKPRIEITFFFISFF